VAVAWLCDSPATAAAAGLAVAVAVLPPQELAVVLLNPGWPLLYLGDITGAADTSWQSLQNSKSIEIN
jgi:hypothetical protein